jgi:hypothetical protein
MTALTLFSWGYWGWGNVTRRFVEGADAVEAARGFAPPEFVDIRISRSVRAVGFRDRAFEQLVGAGRYTWLKSLGNLSVQTHGGPAIQIARPEAASELIDLALAAAARGRRILFFCSCERPVERAGSECHRVTVARLVRAAAAMRGVALETIEWPGGEPEPIEIAVTRTMLRSVRGGRKTVPIEAPEPLARFAGLPWGSPVQLTAGEAGGSVIVSGPAAFTGGHWCLPVVQLAPAEAGQAIELGKVFRKRHGYQRLGLPMKP